MHYGTYLFIISWDLCDLISSCLYFMCNLYGLFKKIWCEAGSVYHSQRENYKILNFSSEILLNHL
jgi:hypothetical protein